MEQDKTFEKIDSSTVENTDSSIEENMGSSTEEKQEARKASKEKRLKDLKKQLEDKIKESQANYDKFLRLYAEFENYKKRIEREKSELIRFANEDLIKELLPVIDNLESALSQSENMRDIQALKDGVNLTLQQFLKVLKGFGLEQVSAIGEKFNPDRHEAVSVEESDEYDEGTIIKEFRKAYFLKDRLLRPALVSVSKGIESREDKKEGL